MTNSFTCSELCGYLAASLGSIFMGSFGVPIKYISTSTVVDVDPLVMQSYKTLLVFLTCWFVIPVYGESARFTPWGIISGLFWVPGATAGIYGIRNAGLAISVGIWASLHVLSANCWGILIFHEQVKNVMHAFLSAIILIVGLIGMSIHSVPTTTTTTSTHKLLNDHTDDHGVELNLMVPLFDNNDDNKLESSTQQEVKKRRKNHDLVLNDSKTENMIDDKIALVFDNFTITRRHIGIIGAAINGFWGGNNLIPMHYAKEQGFYGPGYLISYACGCMLVNLVMWAIRYILHLRKYDWCHEKALKSLPINQFKDYFKAGVLTGIFYSIGNFCCILAISVLGQSVGYSFLQTSMLVSGLWGICFFGEVQGSQKIIKWFISAVIAVVGIINLSLQRHHA